MIASPLEIIFKGWLCKIAKGKGLTNPLEMLLQDYIFKYILFYFILNYFFKLILFYLLKIII